MSGGVASGGADDGLQQRSAAASVRQRIPGVVVTAAGAEPAAGSTRWLSREFAELFADPRRCLEAPGGAEPAFDVLIVGSGYGGAIAAAGFAGRERDGRVLRVAVLERGREYLPGAFPSRLSELPTHLRGRFAGKSRAGEALFDIRTGTDAGVVLANGLGGGSLINAGVMLRAEAAVFDDRWPQALRGGDALAAHYGQAETLLGAVVDGKPNVVPEPRPDKARVLSRLDAATQMVPVTVAFAPRTTSGGVGLSPCLHCGDCATGCNHAAKESLDTNLLATAVHRGAEIYCGATVLRVQRAPGRSDVWAVLVTHTDEALRRCETGPRWILARHLVLAAGALGSTEILLRSQRAGLALSPRLGQGFSGNGDMIAFGYGYGEQGQANAVAHEDVPPDRRRIGPTISAAFHAQARAPDDTRQRRIVVEEMAVPAALRRPAEEVISTVSALYRLDAADDRAHTDGHPQDDGLAVHRDRIRNMSVFAAIGDDGAGGTILLSDEDSGASDAQVDVVWPEARDHSLFEAQIGLLRARAQAAGFEGVTLPNPVWRPLPDRMERTLRLPRGPVVTVHPLGGCAMADDATRGVVDDCGRVFDPAAGAGTVHDGLVVLDGAIVPCALGTNPALTIAALALRAVAALNTAWEFKDGPSPAPVTGPRPRLPLREAVDAPAGSGTDIGVTERLSGELPLRCADGRTERCHVELTLSYRRFPIENLFVPDAAGRLSGTVLDLVTEEAAASEMLVVPAAAREALLRRGLTAEELAREQARLGCRHALRGSLTVFERVATGARARTLRAAGAWFLNRGARDLWQSAREYLRRRGAKDERGLSFTEYVTGMWALLSHAGEVRRFAYALEIGARLPGGDAGFALDLASQDRGLRGHKHIGYTRPGNPWRQLQELEITAMAGLLGAGGNRRLVLDPQYFAERSQPLLRIEAQRCHVEALADLASLGALMLRMLLSLHQLNTRKPDAPSQPPAVRVPGPLPGLPDPDVEELIVDDCRGPVRIRMTRYRKTSSTSGAPVLLIHGYSASGTTFAHPALKSDLVRALAQRGRDVWIVDLRSSAGMKTAILPWTFEQVALADIPAAVEYVVDKTGAAQIDVVAHCMGAVMLSMAVLAADLTPQQIAELLRDRTGLDDTPADAHAAARRALPGRLRRVVLSQNGPGMVMTPQNVFRGYVLSYFEAALGPLEYHFRTDEDGFAGGAMLDRLLATLPYPDDELLRENSPWPWQSTRFVGTRHRMDALYGRTFSLANLDARVLDRIDDFFGPLNLDTVAQVIHFARHQTITDRGGHNRFVDPARLRAHWRFDTLLLHGADNGLADIATLHRNRRLLAEAGCAVRAEILEGQGHQDSLIGRHAHRTFGLIRDFLDGPALPAAAPAAVFLARVPWLGPVRYAGDTEDAYIGLGASPRLGRPQQVCLHPVVRDADGCWRAVPGQAPDWHPVPEDSDWFKLPLPASPATAVLALLVYEQLPGIGVSDTDAATAGTGASPEAAVASALSAQPMLRLGLVETAEPADAGRVRIALGSCQYPPGIFNTFPAQSSWRRLNARLDRGERIDLLLLTGDQVYVDATAGLFDPADLHDRYRKPYETWLHDTQVRDALRRVPLAALPDDHELVDNWQPVAGAPGDPDFDRHLRQRDAGVAGFLRFQRPPAAGDGPLSMTLHSGSVPVCLFDTRVQRNHRASARTDVPLCTDAAAWQRLCDWLRAAPPALPKLVVTPSALLPRHRSALRAELAYGRRDGGTHAALNADGWDGYPASLYELLGMIARERIGQVVFLSGDEHLGLFVEAEIELGGARTKIHSVHAAGLNTPYRFANAAAADFVADERFAFSDGAQQGHCTVRTQRFEGAGFTDVELYSRDGHWHLDCRFESEDGAVHRFDAVL